MDEIDHILNTDPEKLIGLAEGSQLEVKSAHYDLDTAAARYELAKDVSSLANGSGGHLIIGIETTREPDRELDVLERFCPPEVGALQDGKYAGVVREYVYPEIQGVRIDSVSVDDGELAVIRVPPQRPDSQPFVILRVVEDGEHLKEIVIGYAERKSDSSEPMSGKRLQQALRKGSSPLSARLDRIEEKIDMSFSMMASPERSATDSEEKLRRRIDSLLEE